jgi:hypothetical protein
MLIPKCTDPGAHAYVVSKHGASNILDDAMPLRNRWVSDERLRTLADEPSIQSNGETGEEDPTLLRSHEPLKAFCVWPRQVV